MLYDIGNNIQVEGYNIVVTGSICSMYPFSVPFYLFGLARLSHVLV